MGESELSGNDVFEEALLERYREYVNLDGGK